MAGYGTGEQHAARYLDRALAGVRDSSRALSDPPSIALPRTARASYLGLDSTLAELLGRCACKDGRSAGGDRLQLLAWDGQYIDAIQVRRR